MEKHEILTKHSTVEQQRNATTISNWSSIKCLEHPFFLLYCHQLISNLIYYFIRFESLKHNCVRSFMTHLNSSNNLIWHNLNVKRILCMHTEKYIVQLLSYNFTTT